MSKIWMPEFGVYGCECVAKSLPLLQTVMLIRGDIKNGLDVFQGCYHPGVGASAGSHDKGGPVDIGQYTDRHLKTERECGWGANHRTRAQGFSMDHNHMFPIGCTHGSPLAMSQQRAWQNGRNGLVSNGLITGPGPKGKDTPHWKEGVRKMEREIMAFADDVAAKVLKGIGDAVWGADVIPNNFSGNAANKTVPASYALGVLGSRTKDIPGAVNGWDHIPNEYDLNDPNKEIAPASALKLLLRDMRIQKAQIEAILTKLEEPQA